MRLCATPDSVRIKVVYMAPWLLILASASFVLALSFIRDDPRR